MNQMFQPQFVAPFSADNLTVGVLLSQFRMMIPEMQRPYAWTAEQAHDLIRDLGRLVGTQQQHGANHQHFFGSLVVLSKPERDEIVDGQQRMTTVSTLLGVIQQALMDLERAIVGAGGPQAQVNAQNCSALRASIRPKLWRPGPIVAGVRNMEIPVLEVSPEVKSMYLALIEMDTEISRVDKGSPAEHLKQVAAEFREFLIAKPFSNLTDNLDKLRHLQRLYMAVDSGLVVVRLGTQAAGAAYELFESLNARGLDLNALDLIKVWMLAVLSNHNADTAEVARLMRELTSGNKDEQIAFFEDFYWARTENKPSDGKKLYKKLAHDSKRLLFKDPEFADQHGVQGTICDRITSETRRMTVLTDFWRDLKGLTSERERSPRVFAEYKHRQWLNFRLEMLLGSTLAHKGAVYPLLMVAADKLRDEPNDFLQLVHLLERFFFRFRTVCGKSEERIAEVYMKLIRQLETNGRLNFDTVVTDLEQTTSQFADEVTFSDFFNARVKYGELTQPRLRYFFNMIEMYSYNPSPKMEVVALGRWSIEHVQPQNPARGPRLPDELLHSAGNLCLLDPKVNRILQNLDFASKKAKVAELAAKPIPEKIEIDDAAARRIFTGPEAEWGPDQIIARHQALRDAAHKIFGTRLSLISVF
jgi:hypothetical protein